MSTPFRSALVLTPKAHGADGVSALTRLTASSLWEAGIDTRVLALEQDAREGRLARAAT